MNHSKQEAEKTWQKFKQLGFLALKSKRKAQHLIPALAESKIYLKHGFATLEEAASKIVGLKADTVRKILSAYYKTKDLPKLHEQMNKSGYDKVSTVLSLRDKLKEEDLVEMVATLPKFALRQKVKELKGDTQETEQTNIFGEEEFGSGYQIDKPLRCSAESDNQLQQDLNIIKHKLEQEKKHPITNKELLEYLVSVEKERNPPLTHQYKPQKTDFSQNKTLTPLHKTYIKAKNNGICQSQNCNKVATEIHHQKYQSLKPQNHQDLKALCKTHHQLAHYGTKKSSQKQRMDAKVRSYWYLE